MRKRSESPFPAHAKASKEPLESQQPVHLSIVNVIATAELGHSVDLNRVSAEPGFLYDQTVYHCAYLKDSGMIGKVSIFASGKIISIGTKSFRSAKHDLYHAQQKLTDLGLIEHARIKVVLRNLVATGEIGKTVDIQKLVKLPNVIYEPEQFPGAIYHAAELEGASMLIFANGKIVLAGLRSEYSLEVSKRIITQLALLAVT